MLRRKGLAPLAIKQHIGMVELEDAARKGPLQPPSTRLRGRQRRLVSTVLRLNLSRWGRHDHV